MKCPLCNKSKKVKSFSSGKFFKCYDCDITFDSNRLEISDSIFSNGRTGISPIHFFVGIFFIIIILVLLSFGIYTQLKKLEARIMSAQYQKQEYQTLHSQYPKMTKYVYAIIKKGESQYHIPAHITASIIQGESEFEQYAVSRSGAMSYMQLMIDTAWGLGVINPFDPEENILGGIRYYKDCRFVALLKYVFHIPFIKGYDNIDHIAIKLYNCGYNWRKLYFPKESEIYSASCMNRISESEKTKMRMVQI